MLKIHDKIILMEDYSLEGYDMAIFIRQTQFKRFDLFLIDDIKEIYHTYNNIVVYYTLKYSGDLFKDSILYKITPQELIYFQKYNLQIERKLKLNRVTKT